MTVSKRDPWRRERRLLLVSFEQFGYHTDSYEYCRYLVDRFGITYLCPDQGLPRTALDGVEAVYRDHPPLGKVELGLLIEADRLLRGRRFDAAFLRRTKFSFLLRLRHRRTPMVLDVRSGSVEENPLRRALQNGLLRFNATFFPNVTVISEGLARQLRLRRRVHVLPLGADPRPTVVEPRRDELRLVYVGTFKNRRLEQTVEGLGRFVREGNPDLPVSYTLVGFGSTEETNAIRTAAGAVGLEDRVQVRDRLGRDELPSVLAEHNIGVAYTPQVPWFEHQPSTKVFEYLQSGLLCIATDSAANRETISPINGVLTADSADGFRRGLESVAAKLADWDPKAVADSVRGHTWEAIVNKNLAPYLERIMGPEVGF
jgi:glycosyltransferase involved in cell wall biosynthesis